jgi:hypothetical protein
MDESFVGCNNTKILWINGSENPVMEQKVMKKPDFHTKLKAFWQAGTIP